MSSNHSVGAMNQLADALDNAGFTSDDVTRLKQFNNLEGIKDLIYGRAELVMPKILEFVNTVKVCARRERFVARDYFVVDMSAKSRVKICYLGDNFVKWFFGKTEEPVPGSLRYQRLRKSSVDGPIISELGGKERAETTLAEMFSLMEMQADGKDGALLTNGYANIFYIRDTTGVLRAANCRWFGDGWDVHAYSVEGPGAWRDGIRVFSRNS